MSKRLSVVWTCALASFSVAPALLAAKPESASAKPVSRAVKAQSPSAAQTAASEATDLHPPKANSLSDSARLDTYVKPDGSGYFALSLSPTKSLPTAAAGEVVVLFDTSASQIGVFRDRALSALRAFTSECQPTDRVQLIAVDLTAVPMTESFVATDSQAWNDAVEKLQQRIPLGATDIPLALRSALACFSANSTAAKTTVYIGDGISAADVIVPEEFVKLCQEFVGSHLPVTSFATGPRCDGQLLAALANHTGGMLVIDGERIDAKEAGMFLARTIHEQVLWPTSTTFPKVFTAIYPQQTPPLRSDRDTVLIGTGNISNAVDIAMTGTSNGQQVEQKWSVNATRSNNDFSYLTVLVDVAAKNNGSTLPIIGTPGLQEAGRMIASDAEGLARLSGQAVSSGNIESAERLNAEALRRDPNDPNALAVKKQLEKLKAGDPDAAKDLKVERTKNEQAAPPGAGVGGSTPPVVALEDPLGAEYNPSLLDDQLQQNSRVTSMIRSEVDKQLKDAGGRMGEDPNRVQSDLKLMQEQVLKAQELSPDVRAQMLSRLERAMREAARRSTEKERLDIDREGIRAAAEERLRITQSLDRNQEKIKQLMDRFNSLMSEGHYLLAEEAAATEVAETAPDNTIAVSSVLVSRTTRYTAQALMTRVARQKGVVDALAQVEFSHVPFPDDQPIVYPDAGVWEELSMRRKKWKDFASADLKDQKGAAARIRKQLDLPTTIEFVEAPLQDVVDYLKDLHDIEIQIDTKALEDASIGPDTPVTRNLKGITLKSALRLMLGSMDLTYVIKNEVLMITTPEKAGNELVTKVYPVADLVIPITIMRMGNGTGGMGGGQMGGGGGMGGGMGGGGMGGGMGGMGGGMGGMGGGMGGGGMGGGGFFSVADRPTDEPADETTRELPAAVEAAIREFVGNDLGAFAVPDDLKLGPAKNKSSDTKTAAPQPATPAPKAVTAKTTQPSSKTAQRKPVAIELRLKKDGDANAAWRSYFAQHEDVPAEDVRETARQLMSHRRFDQVSALIQGALAHGQVQPWMYEALALAMQASGSPSVEVERALMSAADFGENIDDLMYVAQYMARSGLDERAIKVFRQAGALDPSRPEPFIHGLQLAQRLNDVEGIEWASLGILSQAWPRDKSDVEKSAFLAAKAVYAQLVEEKRTKEAAEFKSKLDKTLIRDIKVVVSWTGVADVDVFVNEPSGTVCSFRNRRTTSGGMMLGDVASADNPEATGTSSETYVCPQGFSGTYKMLLRRVWGKVTAGKVTVDVYTHFGTKQVRHYHTQIPIGDQDTIATFDLADGRRQESLGEQQVANAAIGQVALNQAILNQQLNSASSTAAGNSLVVSRAGNFGAFPVIQQAVGYQPVIITLPAGANFAATGVISADRRYVRITSLPVFSQIGMVTTFNISSGAVGTSPTPPPGGGGVSGGTNGFPPPSTSTGT